MQWKLILRSKRPHQGCASLNLRHIFDSVLLRWRAPQRSFRFRTPHLILFITATLSRESNRKLDVLDFYSRVSARPASYLSILALCKFVFMQRAAPDDETAFLFHSFQISHSSSTHGSVTCSRTWFESSIGSHARCEQHLAPREGLLLRFRSEWIFARLEIADEGYFTQNASVRTHVVASLLDVAWNQTLT